MSNIPLTGSAVSIHASSREDATRKFRSSSHFSMFQSTRPRGRTRRCRHNRLLNPTGFNPRVLAGGRDERSY